MPCMCGDTMCPSCGPAQGYDARAEAIEEAIYLLCETVCPEAVSLDWLAAYVAGKVPQIWALRELEP